LSLVLDTNEYIFAFGLARKPECERLISALIAERPNIRHAIRIPRLIVTEVRKNLSPEVFKEFILFINDITRIDEDISVPFELAAKYEAAGLAPEDAFIAAYAEWAGADFLVSENRHFLARRKGLPFKILSTKEMIAAL